MTAKRVFPRQKQQTVTDLGLRATRSVFERLQRGYLQNITSNQACQETSEIAQFSRKRLQVHSQVFFSALLLKRPPHHRHFHHQHAATIALPHHPSPSPDAVESCDYNPHILQVLWRIAGQVHRRRLAERASSGWCWKARSINQCQNQIRRDDFRA